MFLNFSNSPGTRGVNTDAVVRYYVDTSNGNIGVFGGIFSPASDLAGGTSDNLKFLNAIKHKKTVLLSATGTDHYLVVDNIIGYDARYSSEVTVYFVNNTSYTVSNTTDRTTFLAYMDDVGK